MAVATTLLVLEDQGTDARYLCPLAKELRLEPTSRR